MSAMPVPVERPRRDLIVDVAVIACAVVGGGVGYGSNETPDWLMVLDLVLGLMAVASLGWRRRHPVGVAAFTIVLGAISVSASGAVVLALFSLGVHRQPRTVLAVVLASMLTLPLATSLHPSHTDDPFWLNLLLGVVFTAAVVAWGMFVRARRQLMLQFRERAERAEAEQHLRVEQARQAERTRIAREMHDVLAHRISLLSMHAGALEYRPDAPADEVAKAAAVIRSTAREALEELRGVIGVLREEEGGDRPEPPQPVAADLPGLVTESRQAGMHVVLDVDGTELAAVPELVGRTAYRVVQEGLTNARKHAPHTAVAVTVRGGEGDGLTVAVANPSSRLAPLDELPGAGTGLVGLTERAGLAGGTLEHGRTPDGGYRVRAWLPWE